MKPIIEIHNLGKRYRIGGEREQYLSLRDEIAKKLSPAARRAHAARDEFWALKDVSFEVQQGEAVGIIGRNGAGKSTLLKILSQITPPTEGRIVMRGRVASLLEVGTGFHPELTGRENIYLNGAILGMTRREIARKFDEIVAFAEIDRFLETPVKRYSSGMYVRLAFAVAAHLEPEILVVDEVLAVGDAEFQKKCLGKMGEVARGGRTVLFVSHNMAAVERLCRSATLLRDGTVCASGTAQDVITEYVSGLGRQLTASADLWNHPGRVSGSTRIMRAVRLEGDGDSPVTTVPMGSSLRISLLVDPLEPLHRPAIGIGVNSAAGQRLFTVGSRYADWDVDRVSGPTWVTCELPNLALMPGRYYMKVALGIAQEDLDTIENAAAFDVVAGDFFASGAVPARNQGIMAQRSVWRVLTTASPERAEVTRL
jgi:lipopolysaccharide transport system ATP-binding protein